MCIWYIAITEHENIVEHVLIISQNNCYFLIQISLKFVFKGLIDNKLVLVQIMALWQTGEKSLSEPMIALFTDAYTVKCCYNTVQYNMI